MLTFLCNQAGNTLLRNNISQSSVELPHIPDYVQVIGVFPRQKVPSVKLVLLADHKVEDILEPLVLALVSLGQVEGLVGKLIISSHLFVVSLRSTKEGVPLIRGGSSCGTNFCNKGGSTV